MESEESGGTLINQGSFTKCRSQVGERDVRRFLGDRISKNYLGCQGGNKDHVDEHRGLKSGSAMATSESGGNIVEKTDRTLPPQRFATLDVQRTGQEARKVWLALLASGRERREISAP